MATVEILKRRGMAVASEQRSSGKKNAHGTKEGAKALPSWLREDGPKTADIT
jgi:hypothetical protein